MHALIADIRAYLKEHYPKGGTLYSPVAGKFANTSRAAKKSPPQSAAKKPEPPPSVELPSPKKNQETSTLLRVEKPADPMPTQVSDFSSFYQKHASNMRLCEKTPATIKQAIILIDASMAPYKTLLTRLCHAIETKLAVPCRLLECDKATSDLKTLFLVPHHIEMDQTTWKQATTLPLPPLEQLQKHPEQKKALWQQITRQVRQ